MKKILLSATILMGFSGAAFATSFNDIAIQADTETFGTVDTLVINQGAASANNQMTGMAASKVSPKNVVSSTVPDRATASAFPVTGAWTSIVVNQNDGGASSAGANVLVGSLSAKTGSVVATYNNSASKGANIHYLNVGSDFSGGTNTDTLASNPIANNAKIDVTVTNMGSDANTITDTFSGDSLDYKLVVHGTGNTVTNTASGGTALTMINENIQTDGNNVNTLLTGGGAQSATLNVLTGSKVNYALASAGNGQSTDVTLTGVAGASSGQANVAVYQAAGAGSATATLVYTGAGTAGFVDSAANTPSNYTAVGLNTPTIYVYQASSGAYMNAKVAAPTGSAGYSAKFTQ